MPSSPESAPRAGEGEEPATPAPLPDDMHRGAAEMQRRLEDARRGLKERIPPPDDD
jgi:hypothetical protein